MYRIIDISPKIDENLAVWPGDVSFTRQVHLDASQGDHLTLSSIGGTVHLGAHADASNHYHANGKGIESRSLQPYFGKVQVITVETKKGERVLPADIRDQSILAERILIKTNSYPDPTQFNEDFCSLSPELIQYLNEEGVILVGIDTPSVDPFSSKKLESHQALYETGMAVLEGLVLVEVEDGDYILSALPLPIVGADASPVRAVLIDAQQL